MSLSARKWRRLTRRKRRGRLTPAYIENDLSRQRGQYAGLKPRVIKRWHKFKRQDT